MGKLIQNLTSIEKPIVQEWGEKRHVPINIREIKQTDSQTGEEIDAYMYDVVERVEMPLNYDNIVAAAIDGEFTAEEMSYITKHFANESDARVKAYKTFVSNLQTQLEGTEYAMAE